jgi:hypothetical protein
MKAYTTVLLLSCLVYAAAFGRHEKGTFHCDCWSDTPPFETYPKTTPPPPTPAPLQWALVRRKGFQYRDGSGPWSDTPPPVGLVQGDIP